MSKLEIYKINYFNNIPMLKINYYPHHNQKLKHLLSIVINLNFLNITF